MKPTLWTAALGLAVLLPARARAADPSVSCDTATRHTVVACALALSPELSAQLGTEAAAAGRRSAAGVVLPSHPVVSAGVASRSSPAAQGLNWNVGLAQELEVTGQRGLRIDAADRELAAEGHRAAATRSAIAADAWSTWFRTLAHRQRLALAVELDTATAAVAATARGMTAAGLGSEVDADVADAAALRAAQSRIDAEVALDAEAARLARLTGAANTEGELEPLAVPAGPIEPPDLAAAREAHLAATARIALLRRTRLPNPTVSLFAQSDGFDERVFGVGLSLPLGAFRTGEIEEAVGLARRAEADAHRATLDRDEALAQAGREYQARLKARALYDAERSTRARARLAAIAQQVKAARLPVREALLAQQALVDQLAGEVAAREALCLASVRLRRAAGHSLEGDPR